MKTIEFGQSKISSQGPAYFIAEIGHNHQGSLDTAKKMIQVAALNGTNAVKLQKRDNRSLYTSELYAKPYENENSYGVTYGEHREFLEFGMDEYKILKKCAEDNGVEFMSTAFDFPSVDFLEELGIASYKIASGDLTTLPLLRYIAKLGKPMFVSTGAATLDEIRMAYNEILKYNDKLVLLHCVAGYPTEYQDLNLRFIERLIKEFPEAIIGYSGHDNGILAPVMAYMLGAVVIEKHFTLNRAWKGTDHKFSLEPEGLRKQIRDLRRIDMSLGDGSKSVKEFEIAPKTKMGKGIYASRDLPKGSVITDDMLALKSPTNATPAFLFDSIVGKTLKIDLKQEQSVLLGDLE